ncbi:MAG: RNA methyltransferase [Phycisphaerae bacterium]|nr:RNA methyltransferase [Phycisphaerae bacterium]
MEHIEGRHAVLAALQARQRRIRVILLRHGIHASEVSDILQIAQSNNIPIRYVEQRELNALAHGVTHGGIVAIAGPKAQPTLLELLRDLPHLEQAPLLLLLEGIDDARNLGFVLRTAEACGAAAVLVKKHLKSLDPVEIGRPSSGAYERIPMIAVATVDELLHVKRAGIRLIGCLSGVKRSIWQTDLTPGVCLAIGGEKRGLSSAVRRICDAFATNPTVGGASSLSLSHAAAIVLAEALRQRTLNPNLTAGVVTAESSDSQADPFDREGDSE